MDLIEHWSRKRRCTKRQLQSLIGKLHFVCHACRPGRIFLRRMIDVLCKVQHPTHHIRLNRAFHNDLLWWKVSSCPGMAAVFSTTPTGSPLRVSNSIRMHLMLALASISQANGFTGPLMNTTFPFLAPLRLKSYTLLLLRSTHGLVNSPVTIFFFTATTPLWCRLYLMA